MTKHVPIATFKDRVSEFVAEAQAGEEVIITRHGKEAARLVPPAKDKTALRKEAVEKIRSVRAMLRDNGHSFSSEEIRDMLEEDRP
jgi:prevent-host-death family protein